MYPRSNYIPTGTLSTVSSPSRASCVHPSSAGSSKPSRLALVSMHSCQSARRRVAARPLVAPARRRQDRHVTVACCHGAFLRFVLGRYGERAKNVPSTKGSDLIAYRFRALYCTLHIGTRTCTFGSTPPCARVAHPRAACWLRRGPVRVFCLALHRFIVRYLQKLSLLSYARRFKDLKRIDGLIAGFTHPASQ
jgi:hypothetical protein